MTPVVNVCEHNLWKIFQNLSLPTGSNEGKKVDNIVTGGGVAIGQKEDHALFDLFKF
jgi:hypothetical protein